MPDAALEAGALCSLLSAKYDALPASALLNAMLREEFPGRIALVSSFGAEAAVLLHLVAQIDRRTPVIFLDSGKLFKETLNYRGALVAQLGLTDVRSVNPDPQRIVAADPRGVLWATNPDRCCFLRKVEPLERALSGFDAWINGRKRHHGGLRADLPVLEADGARIKINPLAQWDRAAIDAYFAEHGLPRHPLEAQGYRSIGCAPCSTSVRADEDARAGRWRGLEKTECGIHTRRPRGALQGSE